MLISYLSTVYPLELMKPSVSVLPENRYLALKPKSPWEASVWKWTQSSGVKTTMGITGTMCPQNLANSSPSESPEGGGRKFKKSSTPTVTCAEETGVCPGCRAQHRSSAGSLPPQTQTYNPIMRYPVCKVEFWK